MIYAVVESNLIINWGKYIHYSVLSLSIWEHDWHTGKGLCVNISPSSTCVKRFYPIVIWFWMSIILQDFRIHFCRIKWELDKETGIIYQAQSTVPERCYNKVFAVKGKEGTVLDLQIVFPRLPENAKNLAIYGVSDPFPINVSISIIFFLNYFQILLNQI